MTIRHLKIFKNVYRTGSMTETARLLYMTQPSISQAIRELEESYNVVLFERMHHKLYATSVAEKLYFYADKVLELYEEMETDIKKESKKERLRIGANYTVGASMVGEFISELKKEHQGAEITVCVNKSSVLKEKLRKNQLDLLLIEEQKNERDLIQEYFYLDRVAIVAAPEHALSYKKYITPKELARERFLMRERGAGSRDQFEMAMRNANVMIHPYWESISVTALLTEAKKGEGIAVLPYETVKEELKKQTLVELKIAGIELNRRLAIIGHKNKKFTTIMQDFIEICHAYSIEEDEACLA